MEYTPSNLLRRITTPGQGYSEFHYGIDRQRVIRRDGNQAGVSRRVHYNGIIHMNGRIYDPHLARFLQADPFVEDPGTLNRYTYVHNNPLVYYDPSGYFSLKSFLKIGAAVAISFLGGQIMAGKIWASLGIKAGSAAAYGVAAAAGALSGYIMTGSLEGTLWGAFSAVTFYGIGQKFGSSLGDGKGVIGSGYSKAELARATVAHGVAGGTLSKLQGGRFGHGLASAGITKVASPAIEFAANDNSFAEVTMATIAGGSISSISGGKFANGAVTATMAYAFNQLGSSKGDTEGSESRWTEEEIRVAVEDAQSEYWARIRRLSPEEFMREFSDWHMHPILNVDSDPLLVREVGLATLRDQGGLAAGRIANLRRYTASQLAEIYGFGATGAALGRMPKT